MYDYKAALAGFLNLSSKSEIGDIYWADTTAIFNITEDKFYIVELVEKGLESYVIKRWKGGYSYLNLQPKEEVQTLEELENGFHVAI